MLVRYIHNVWVCHWVSEFELYYLIIRIFRVPPPIELMVMRASCNWLTNSLLSLSFLR
jgi:hypothetical protein